MLVFDKTARNNTTLLFTILKCEYTVPFQNVILNFALDPYGILGA